MTCHPMTILPFEARQTRGETIASWRAYFEGDLFGDTEIAMDLLPYNSRPFLTLLGIMADSCLEVRGLLAGATRLSICDESCS